MEKCIYTLKDSNEAIFDSEHIFPASIGGSKTLPEGWVSKEFNNMMSKSERLFSRKNPLIVLHRMFEGPKESKRKHEGKFGVDFIKQLDADKLKLGYIEDGAPYIIPQIIFPYPIPTDMPLLPLIEMILSADSDEMLLYDTLKAFTDNSKFEIVKTGSDSFIGKLSLGVIRKRLYVGIHSQMDEGSIHDHIKNFIEIFNREQPKASKIQIKKSSSPVEYQFLSAVDMRDFLRVSAKIAFNCLAYLTGQEFVLRDAFNGFRNAIVTGENIENYVCMDANLENRIFNVLNLGRSHFAIFVQTNEGMLGSIGFYGGDILLKVHPSEFVLPDFGYETRGYICDWQNKDEYTLTEHLMRNVVSRCEYI